MDPIRVSISAIAIALAATMGIGVNAVRADGSALKSSNPNQFEHWYGRAGGVAGSDRIEALHEATLPPPRVYVDYDKAVAERTNMQRQGLDSKEIGISYDQAIAERTNMGRSQPQTSEAVAKSQK
jgi:hypothetical protein